MTSAVSPLLQRPAYWRAIGYMLVAFARVLVRPGQANRPGQRAKADMLSLCTSAVLAELTGELRTLDARRDDLSAEDFDAFHQMLAVASALIMLAVFLQSVRLRMGGGEIVGWVERRDTRRHSAPCSMAGFPRIKCGVCAALRLMPGGYFDSG